MHFFYLHGFASSPRSLKAAFFGDRLARLGIALQVPDFNQPEFFSLTVSRMIRQLHADIARLPPGPVAIIGSSLGAFVALHACRSPAASPSDAHPIDRMVLLAPALDFNGNHLRLLGPGGLARWRESDRLEVFHYGYREVRPVWYALYEDATRYDTAAFESGIPILIFQGRRDDTVDPEAPVRFSLTRPNVTVRLLDDDHQLLESLDEIWKGSARFLGIPER